MDINFRFTDKDLMALEECKEALHRIDCLCVPCDKCPLYLGQWGCVVNRLAYIIRDAEKERGSNNGT